MTLRIAQISTLHRPVPPPGEGSVEHLVGRLTERLVRKGHEVTLFATAESQTSARLSSPAGRVTSKSGNIWDWRVYEAWQVREAFRDAGRFDVIHCHSYHYGLLLCDLVATPSLHSLHVEPGPDVAFLAANTRNRHLHCASQWQARALADVPGVHVIAHGVDPDDFPCDLAGRGQDYLAFLGRFLPDKGPLEAIDIARRAGMPLKLAAPRNAYYEEAIAPRVDGEQIQYVGELAGREKAAFLAGARALLYPIRRPEPFGLVLIEALMCGVPVLACGLGAVPEIVEHGVNGWLAEQPLALIDYIEALDRLESADKIREGCTASFSEQVMADRLEALLVQVAGERKS